MRPKNLHEYSNISISILRKELRFCECWPMNRTRAQWIPIYHTSKKWNTHRKNCLCKELRLFWLKEIPFNKWVAPSHTLRMYFGGNFRVYKENPISNKPNVIINCVVQHTHTHTQCITIHIFNQFDHPPNNNTIERLMPYILCLTHASGFWSGWSSKSIHKMRNIHFLYAHGILSLT